MVGRIFGCLMVMCLLMGTAGAENERKIDEIILGKWAYYSGRVEFYYEFSITDDGERIFSYAQTIDNWKRSDGNRFCKGVWSVKENKIYVQGKCLDGQGKPKNEHKGMIEVVSTTQIKRLPGGLILNKEK